MKAADILIPIGILIGLAFMILPPPRDRPPQAYSPPQIQKLRQVGMAMIYFEDTYKRYPKNEIELRTFIRLKNSELNIPDSSLVFTFPDGKSAPWLLLPEIKGELYLAASPDFSFGSETRQLVIRKDNTQEVIKK